MITTEKKLTEDVIGCAIEVHRALGPGLLESAYESCLAYEFDLQGIKYERQKVVPIVYKGMEMECGYRADLLVEEQLIIEIKSVSALLPVHDAQVLSYMKMSGCWIGLLLNFNEAYLKNGIKRLRV